MRLQSEAQAEREFELGKKALDEDDFETALAHFKTALELNNNPCWYSYLGNCLARGLGYFWMGVELCLESLAVEKANATHYLNLGKVYLSSGNREEALLAFRQGLALGGNEEILRMLINLGRRHTPVFKSLPRSNPLNKFLGLSPPYSPSRYEWGIV